MSDLPGGMAAPADRPEASPVMPRLRRADRRLLCPPMPLDDLLEPDHLARTVLAFVQRLDLAPLYAAIGSRGTQAGAAATDPEILAALWLFATLNGVVSARVLARLCVEHVAYRWLCGGVGMNPHTLSDFRVAHAAWLERVFTSEIAGLLEAGVISLEQVAQDGMRVRAAAGAGSFRRGATLQAHLQAAEAQVETLEAAAQDVPAGGNRRAAAARARSARSRRQRLQAAVAALPEAERRQRCNGRAKKKRKGKKGGPPPQPRTSMTDAEATVMKMADGGFRPAFNIQFAAETQHGIIVGVDASDTGADQPSLLPMVQQVIARTGWTPKRWLMDGGFINGKSITALQRDHHIVVYAPPKASTGNRDPAAPVKGDTPEQAEWRARMATDEAKQIYRQRGATIECVNAHARQRRLYSITVRGRAKARTIALWYAVAHNLMCSLRLERQAAAKTAGNTAG
jgi:transposase